MTKDEDDSKTCDWCSEEVSTLYNCSQCDCKLCVECSCDGMCRNCFENLESEKRAKNAAAKN